METVEYVILNEAGTEIIGFGFTQRIVFEELIARGEKIMLAASSVKDPQLALNLEDPS